MSQLLAQINHFFFPQESNNHKARVLHPSFLSLIVAAFLTSQFFLNYFALLYPRVLGYAANISPEKLIEVTNVKRVENGLQPLKTNSVLNQAAQMKAGDMFALDYWAHNSPVGKTPWFFFQEAGYSYLYAGENLARDFNDYEAVVTAWMDSPTHRDNILNDHYQEIGIAVVNGTLDGIETTLVVQLFGTPTPTPAPEAQTSQSSITSPVLATSEATIAAQPIQKPPLATAPPQAQPLAAPPESPSLVSPFSLTKVMITVLIALLVGLFAFDLYLVSQRKVTRLSSRSLAHLTFFLFLILAIFATQPGLVL